MISPSDDGRTTDPEALDTKGAANETRPRRAGVAVRSETLARLLADTSAGLSANAIAEQAGAGYNPTLKLLRELEAAGQVRRSGSRRSTVWRLITDEERIAERAAELERRRSIPSQRRRRAGPRSVADQEPHSPSRSGAPNRTYDAPPDEPHRGDRLVATQRSRRCSTPGAVPQDRDCPRCA